MNLIERLEAYRYALAADDRASTASICKLITDAIDALERFQWVSVETRLPPEGRGVLWTMYDGEDYMVSRRKPAHATHWMPLPEPPE